MTSSTKQLFPKKINNGVGNIFNDKVPDKWVKKEKKEEVLENSGTSEGADKGWEARKSGMNAMIDSRDAIRDGDSLSHKLASNGHSSAQSKFDIAAAKEPDKMKKKYYEMQSAMHRDLSRHHQAMSEHTRI